MTPHQQQLVEKEAEKRYDDPIYRSQRADILQQSAFLAGAAFRDSLDEWVRVEDGLVQVDNVAGYSERVLCLCDTGAYRLGYVLHGEWMMDDGVPFKDKGYVVTHWRPLPPSPDPDKK